MILAGLQSFDLLGADLFEPRYKIKVSRAPNPTDINWRDAPPLEFRVLGFWVLFWGLGFGGLGFGGLGFGGSGFWGLRVLGA